MLDRHTVLLVRDLELEAMDIWAWLVTTKAKIKPRSTGMADMDLQLLDRVALAMEGGHPKDTMDKVVASVKMRLMHLKLMTVKVEDTVHLLPKIHMPKTMGTMELQLVDMAVDNLRVNIRMISIPTMDGHFLLLTASTLPTLLGH